MIDIIHSWCGGATLTDVIRIIAFIDRLDDMDTPYFIYITSITYTHIITIMHYAYIIYFTITITITIIHYFHEKKGILYGHSWSQFMGNLVGIKTSKNEQENRAIL